MSKFLSVFQGENLSSPPIWLMRQAGRHLPEYRKIREQCATFLDLCYTPELAARVTLQPIERFDYDAAILFSDILTIPHGLGQHVSFEEGHGPRLSELTLSSFQKELTQEGFEKKVAPVYETIRLVRSGLPASKTLIGFAGAPWTLALYMLEGEGTRDFAKAKLTAFQDENRFSELLAFVSQTISRHLIEQIRAGVGAVQLFDSWAGLCPATHFQKWILEPTQKIVSRIRDVFPEIPVIGFPRGVGGKNMVDYASQCGFSAVSLDSSIPLLWAAQTLPSGLVLQGNLDPLVLCAGGDGLKRAIHSIHGQMGTRPYIFNLGHGVVPQTPLNHVADCVAWVRELGK